MQREPRQAADAFYWAAQLDPAWADPLYARYVALLMSDTRRLVLYMEGDRRTRERPDVLRTDSLYLRALRMDPFVQRRFDRELIRLYVMSVMSDDPSQRAMANFYTEGVMRDLPPMMRGRVMAGEGRVAQALQAYDEALRDRRNRRSESLRLIRQERGRTFALAGNDSVALVEFGQALEAVQEAEEGGELVFLYDSKAVLEHSRGLLLERRGDRAAAREAYARALTEDLSYHPAHQRMGALALAEGDTATALCGAAAGRGDGARRARRPPGPRRPARGRPPAAGGGGGAAGRDGRWPRTTPIPGSSWAWCATGAARATPRPRTAASWTVPAPTTRAAPGWKGSWARPRRRHPDAQTERGLRGTGYGHPRQAAPPRPSASAGPSSQRTRINPTHAADPCAVSFFPCSWPSRPYPPTPSAARSPPAAPRSPPRRTPTTPARTWRWARPAWRDRPREAADAFYWAYQINPTLSDALYGRYTAMLMINPSRLVQYWDGERRLLRQPEIMAIDSLYYRALTMDPFLYRRFEAGLFRMYLESWAREELDRSGGMDVTEGEVRRWVTQMLLNGSPYIRGREAYARGQFQDALRLYEEALRESRQRSRSYLRAERARLHAHMRSWTPALTDMTQALEDMRRQDQRDLVYLYESKALLEHGVGMLHERMANLPAAREAYGRALTEELSFYPAHVRLATLAPHGGRHGHGHRRVRPGGADGRATPACCTSTAPCWPPWGATTRRPRSSSAPCSPRPSTRTCTSAWGWCATRRATAPPPWRPTAAFCRPRATRTHGRRAHADQRVQVLGAPAAQ